MVDIAAVAEGLGRRLGDQIVAPDPQAVHEAWRGYMSSDASTRLWATQDEFEPLRGLLPLTVDAIARVVRDCFLAFSSKFGLIRVLVVEESGKYYPAISFPPKPEIAQMPQWRSFLENAPREFVELYTKRFDGLTNAYQFGGPIALQSMTRWSDENFDYLAYPWGAEFWRNEEPANFLQIFNSGGGGALYLDLGRAQARSPAPVVTLFLADQDEPLVRDNDFWAYLDQWTSIGMSGS